MRPADRRLLTPGVIETTTAVTLESNMVGNKKKKRNIEL